MFRGRRTRSRGGRWGAILRVVGDGLCGELGRFVCVWRCGGLVLVGIEEEGG